MRDHTSKLTKDDQKYYDELKREFPDFYSQAILNSECMSINHKLPLKISADIERNMVLFTLDICRYWRRNR